MILLFWWYIDLSHFLHCRHITPEKFYVEACDDGANDVLTIDRVSTEVTLAGISSPLLWKKLLWGLRVFCCKISKDKMKSRQTLVHLNSITVTVYSLFLFITLCFAQLLTNNNVLHSGMIVNVLFFKNSVNCAQKIYLCDWMCYIWSLV